MNDDPWAAAYNRLSNEVVAAVDAGMTPADVRSCVDDALDEADADA